LHVVTDILEASKLEAGRDALVLADVDVDAVLVEIEATMGPNAHRAHVALVVDRPAVPLAVRADRLRLVQILINLVGNAIKFSDGKGTVTLSAAASGPVVELRVRDQGIGIDPRDHQLIFESFRQVDSSHTRKFGGTGLGLSITRKLVELHGGTISVESALGQGATFVITLPRAGPVTNAGV
jgi:signal transduction histidine kinase